MESEVKEVVYIAISYLILSLVLGIASFAIKINNDFGDMRNEQVIAAQQVQQYNQFNKYDKKTVIGDEIIECIRMYYSSGISIFVDDRTNIDTAERINSKVGCSSGNLDDDHRIFNIDQYLMHKNAGDNNYFNIGIGDFTRPKNDLRTWFPTSAKYRAYLVYNSENVVSFYDRVLDAYTTEWASLATPVTGDEATDLLDSMVSDPAANSEVTGVVFINLETYGG